MDDTMSEEQAFGTENGSAETFKFDEPTAKIEESTDSTSSEDKAEDVSSEDEKLVPYSRLKTTFEKLEQRDSMIASLEERLASLEESRVESKSEEIDVPKEWVELYGDSDVSKRAYQIQVQREMQIEERATERALKMFEDREVNQVKALEQNEEIIDNSLADLQETIGKKITPKMEEEILSIVDEFSPTGKDGKYISLFPFDKAYEIYTLRNSQATRSTNNARNQVADLTGNSSQGEADSSGSDFKRGWDNWRQAL